MWVKVSFVSVAVLFAACLLTTPVQSDFKGAMTDKFAEELIATPMQEGWKDIYQYVVHKKGAQLLRALRYMGGNAKTKLLAEFVMEKLRVVIFEGRANPAVWTRLTKEYWFLLNNWWSSSPEDPETTLETGIWHSLVLLHKDFLANSMKGSDRLQALNELLFDPELSVINGWAKEWIKKHPPTNANAPKDKSDKATDKEAEAKVEEADTSAEDTEAEAN